jgi:multidrug efflux pump subunit AcrA (membrane-fusion protein)
MKKQTINSHLTSALAVIKHAQVIATDFLYRGYKRITHLLVTKPDQTFFSLIGIFLVLIVIGNIIRKPAESKKTTEIKVKAVATYSIGSAPKVTTTAKIEKSGAIKIIAQSAGIVSGIYKTEGQTVNRGDWIVSLSTNYQGGVVQSAARQIAQTNYTYVTDNYQKQLDMLNKRRDIANSVDSQADALRDISGASIDDTKNLISLDDQIVSTLDSQISSLEASNSAHANDATILQAKQGKVSIQSGLLSLKSALRNAELQNAGDKAPANLSNQQKDLTIAQLDLEEKSLALNKELARLNLVVAQINEALMYPAAPFAGTVERIHVVVGQNVSVGTVLATLTGTKNSATAIVSVSKEFSESISRIEPSTLHIGATSIDVLPHYISKESTEGALNSIQFAIPDEYASQLGNGSSILVDLPIGSAQTTAAIPFIPLDALYQSQTDSYVYTATQSAVGTWTVATKRVSLGNVFGEFTEVTRGLSSGDQIIIDRTVVDGDVVTLSNKQ